MVLLHFLPIRIRGEAWENVGSEMWENKAKWEAYLIGVFGALLDLGGAILLNPHEVIDNFFFVESPHANGAPEKTSKSSLAQICIASFRG